MRDRSLPKETNRGFSLLELLVVIAIISILASLLLPVLSRANDKARQAACFSNLKQLGLAWQLYLQDFDRFPDARSLKASHADGYRPWSGWPASDPRSAWAALVLRPYTDAFELWSCPAIFPGPLQEVEQNTQPILTNSPATTRNTATYWLWRFDQVGDPVPLDNFWGKTPQQCVADLVRADNPFIGIPSGTSDVELIVDPYYPSTIPTVPEAIKGLAVHRGGKNRLFLDGHAAFHADQRLR